MRVLFFDTSCDFILVGLYTLSESEVVETYFYSGNHPREASFRLLNDIKLGMETANWDKPDVIICCKGPGSFTGIRISVSTARNLSQIWEVPTQGFDTIELYATYYAEYFQSPIIVTLDGKQKKVFCGYFDKNSYKGTFDILPSEIPFVFKDEIQNSKIVSDTNLVEGNYDLLSNLPSPLPLLKNKLSEILKLNLKNNSYSTLLPKYMRETYAHTKILPMT